MTMTRVSTALLLAGAMALGACAAGPAPTDHFYRFDLPQPESRFDVPVLKGTLLVTRPWADALTGERHLLYRQNGGSSQLRRHAYHRWVDSPTLMLQREIARYLRAAGVADQVVTPELRTKMDYLLSCRIAKLERVLDSSPHVTLELELGITRMEDRRALLLETYLEEQSANGNGIAASVAAYNMALSKILDRFMAEFARSAHAGTDPVTR